MTTSIVKRDGRSEPLNIEKIHQVVSFACKDLTNVSPSEVELKAQLSFFDGIKTTQIQECLIKSAGDLISEDTPNYQHVAGRLILYSLRKEVFGEFEPSHLYPHVKWVVSEGFYTKELLEWYTEEEFNKMNDMIDHERDEDLVYAAMEQFRNKYLVKDRSTKTIYETPQIAYILIAATLFSGYPKATRLKYVKDFYELISKHYVSLPTPIMSGVRTPMKQFSSCVLISAGDSLDEMNGAANAIIKYVSQRAGIGLNTGMIRAKGSSIRNGDIVHTGVVPFLKYFAAATKCCSKGGIRDGAATFNFPFWHLEIEDILVLKNDKGTPEQRVREVDYVIQTNQLFFERYLKGQDITLFSPHDVEGLYDAFFQDQAKFKELYVAAEKNPLIRKTKMSAKDLFDSMTLERKETGRIYLMNVDHANTHSSYDEKKTNGVRMTNLCVEILQADVKPFKSIDDESGRIALCTLGAINLGKINDPEDFEKPCELLVRALDALLDYQKYPVKAAELHTKEYRPLGIGISNLAYWLAKNDLSYDADKKTLEKFHEFMEAYSYYLIKASNKLAQEFGPCIKHENTKYSQGIVNIDTYKSDVDDLVKPKYHMDWKQLRSDLKEFGIRNSTLMAQMPVETSSVVCNATNGIEPPLAYIPNKGSKDGYYSQVVPGYPRIKNKYQLLWDQKSCVGYLKICAVLTKFIDQAISASTFYNPKYYKDSRVSLADMQEHILLAYKWGISNLYYCTTDDESSDSFVLTDDKKDDNIVEVEFSKGCESGACSL